MTERYQPADAFRSPRFSGIRTFMRLPHVTDMEGVDFAVVGLPFDTATSFRAGARFGPEAIRAASALLRPYNAEQDVDIFAHLSGVDAGDLQLAPGDTVGTYKLAEEGLGALIDAGVFPIVLGGDHAITLAELRAMRRGTARSRWCTSTRTAIRGTSTSASATTTGRRSGGRPRRA